MSDGSEFQRRVWVFVCLFVNTIR